MNLPYFLAKHGVLLGMGGLRGFVLPENGLHIFVENLLPRWYGLCQLFYSHKLERELRVFLLILFSLIYVFSEILTWATHKSPNAHIWLFKTIRIGLIPCPQYTGGCLYAACNPAKNIQDLVRCPWGYGINEYNR